MNYQEGDDYTGLSIETKLSFQASQFSNVDASDVRRSCTTSSKQVPDQQGAPYDAKTTRSQLSSVTSGQDADKLDEPAEGITKAARMQARLSDRKR